MERITLSIGMYIALSIYAFRLPNRFKEITFYLGWW